MLHFQIHLSVFNHGYVHNFQPRLLKKQTLLLQENIFSHFPAEKQLLNAQKMGEHEAEIEKIKNVFLTILRDIKKDIDNGEQPGEAVTAAMFQAMQDALAEQKQNPLSIDDVAAMVAGQIGQLTPMDEETADLFKQLAKKMMKGIE